MRRPKTSITQDLVLTLPPGEYRDADTPNFVLRIRTLSGGEISRSFELRYSWEGRLTRCPIGEARAMKVAVAKKKARDLVADLWKGIDPAAAIKAERAKRDRPEVPTVEELVRRAIASSKLSAASLRNYRQLLKNDIVPKLGSLQASDLAKSQILSWAEEIRARAPYVANRAFGLVRMAFRWGVSINVLATSPFEGLRQPFQDEKSSDRVLSPEELRALLFGLDDVHALAHARGARSEPIADAVEVLLYTGVRERSVMLAEPGELSLDDERPTWTIPPQHLKLRVRSLHKAQPLVVPLSRQAATVFRRRLEVAEGMKRLWPRTVPSAREVSDSQWWSSRVVALIKKKAQARLGRPMAPWKIHNLRTAISTHLMEGLLPPEKKKGMVITPAEASAGPEAAQAPSSTRKAYEVPEHVISAILGHSPASKGNATHIYIRAKYLNERREALQQWADYLDALRRVDIQLARGAAS